MPLRIESLDGSINEVYAPGEQAGSIADNLSTFKRDIYLWGCAESDDFSSIQRITFPADSFTNGNRMIPLADLEKSKEIKRLEEGESVVLTFKPDGFKGEIQIRFTHFH